jgi:hypothetical protein
MPSRGQGCRASGLRLQHPKDLLQCHNAWTEGVTIVLDYLGQLPDQRFGLLVGQLKVHAPDMGYASGPCQNHSGSALIAAAIIRCTSPETATELAPANSGTTGVDGRGLLVIGLGAFGGPA